MTRDQVLQLCPELVSYAKDHGLRVSFVTEDTVRADIDFVVDLYNACIEAGTDRAVICDTVGVMTPAAMRWFITECRRRMKPVQLSVHCHNDFGMGVANTLAALEAGAEVPHTTVNGIGERAGNTPLEETAVALEALYRHPTGLRLERLPELSALVEELSGIPISITKPIVGYNAFRHESGIHTDGVLKHTLTYEPIQPEMVGRKRHFVFGKHTGAAAVRDRLKSRGMKLPDDKVVEIVQAVKAKGEALDLADQRAFVRQWRDREENLRGVSEEEFWAIVERVAGVNVGAR
jgi:isopropylmalate/homocitrate/citramalate synthase